MHQTTCTQPVDDKLPAFQAYQRQFTDYLRDPPKQGPLPEALPPNIGVYARLLHNKIDGSLRNCFPVTRELLGAAHWRQLVQDFISGHRCQSPLYREIPDEFIDYLMHEKDRNGMPEYMIDLAHYEWMELVLETATPEASANILRSQANLLKLIPVLNPVLHLLQYRFPVHRITPTDPHWKNWEDRRQPYDEEPALLVGLRDKRYRIEFIEVNAVTARLIELLRDNFRTGEQALLQLAVEMRYSPPESILPFGIEILQQLEAQRIIIGARNEP